MLGASHTSSGEDELVQGTDPSLRVARRRERAGYSCTKRVALYGSLLWFNFLLLP